MSKKNITYKAEHRLNNKKKEMACIDDNIEISCNCNNQITFKHAYNV
jgi:hypothetical protein